MKPIYLDHNASTPLDEEVIQAMTPYLKESFGNPSSSHYYGKQSKVAIEKARGQVAGLINCNSDEIIFTGGGSESNNLAIRGIAESFGKGHIITSSIEHPAVLEVCKYLEGKNFTVSYLPVDKYGIIDPKSVEMAITDDTILITVMLANNEVGTLEPIKEIGEIARREKIIFHTDAAQAVGKIDVDVNTLSVDLLSIAGHKMNAPKGVGALYIKNGIKLQPIIFGAEHERGLRPGTENVLEIVGLGAAAEIFKRNKDQIISKQWDLSNSFLNEIKTSLPNVKLNGHKEKRLPNTLNLFFPGIDSNSLLSAIPEIAASAGAACHSTSITPSHVLKAMGFDTEQALGSIRFSLGRTTTDREIKIAVKKIIKTVKSLTSVSHIRESISEHTNIKLTQYTHGLGCACKIRPQNLEKILKKIALPNSDSQHLSFDSSDDAAVYKVNDKIAIVSTVDFFTPIVDDPYDFGRIAAANSLSDIYAMGAKPSFALNIAAFPEKRLPIEVLENILKGAQSIAKEAGIPILGGHTIEDNEPKFGLAVTGIIDPAKILKNNSLRESDVLILTKPLGLGILTTALKQEMLDERTRNNIISIMTELNAKSAQIISRYPVSACTDVTGFGLLGHLSEMVKSNMLDAEISYSQIPVIPETERMISLGIVPGGTKSNMEFVESNVMWNDSIQKYKKIILCDSQTSGGLLFSINEKFSEELLAELHKNDIEQAGIIGKIIQGEGKIKVGI